MNKNIVFGSLVLLVCLFATVIMQNCSTNSVHLAAYKESEISKSNFNTLEIDLKDPIKKVLLDKKDFCVSSFHCVKYINVDGTKVKVLEIIIKGKESVQIKTYGEHGQPVDLESEYELELKGTRDPARIDVNLVKVSN